MSDPNAPSSDAPSPHGVRVYHPIPADGIDREVIKVVRRLRRFSHQAYLVGGCVRDLLLSACPKDFDVATSASPREVRRMFRNSRVIGRRFQLVHVLFREGKVIEVATFRQAPIESEGGDDDLLIRDDNVFGSAADDAFRRDFTINALFYDLHSREIVDFISGLADIEDRLVRSIGDPHVRVREDPVRMLRAIKFASRLDLRIEDELWAAIRCHREEIRRAAPPRLLEEIFRIFRPGRSVPALALLRSSGLLELLFPELTGWLDGGEPDRVSRCEALMLAFDRVWARAGEVPPDAVIIAVLLWLPWQERLAAIERDGEGRVDVGRRILDFLAGARERLPIPRRAQDRVRQVLVAQPRFEPGRGRGKPAAVVQRSFFADALGLYEVRMRAEEGDLRRVQAWRDRAGLGPLEDAPSEEGEATPKRRRRRRRRRRKGDDPE